MEIAETALNQPEITEYQNFVHNFVLDWDSDFKFVYLVPENIT